MTEIRLTSSSETAARGLVSSSDLATSRAVIYLRVSTAEQADTDYSTEGFSLPAQREACRKKAQELGAAVVDEYMDRGESARSANRPALQAMLQRLRLAHDIDYVIVHKLDRLARSREDDVSIVMDIRTAGAQLVSASENIDETPSGMLVHGIMATIAEFYSRNLSVEAKKGMSQKAKVGGTPHLAPIGYRNAPAMVEGREIRTVIIDPERAPHVRWAFETFVTGEWTLSQLTEALEERGLLSLGNRRYPPSPLHRSKVHRMLRNAYYVGIVTYNGAQYPGRHEPLIDLELFEDVQAVLDQRSKGKEKPVKRTHYLKGMLACGQCGKRLGISWNRSKTGATYPYFFCLGRHGHDSNGCQLPYLPMEQVEADIERYWRNVRVREHELEKIRTDVRELIHLAAAEHETEISTQTLRLQRLASEEKKLLQAHYADAISLPLLQQEQKRILGERARAEGLVAALNMETAAMERTLDLALQRVERCDEVYMAGGPQVRRELCFGLFTRIYISTDGVVGADLATPFAQILDPELEAKIEADTETIRSGGLGELLTEQDTETAGAREEVRPIERPNGRFGWESKNPEPGQQVRGSNVTLLVGHQGLEP